jgi:hypothetical protein
MERCVADVRAWMLSNKLKLNTGKTEFVIFVAPHFRKAIARQRPTLRVGNDVVHPTETVRNLGAVLDASMTMMPFINQLVRSCYYHLRGLKRIRCYLDDQTCARAVQALIVSRLDYCNCLLAALPDCALNKLRLVQNVAARLITGTARRAHITPVLRQLHWLPIRQRITFKVMCLTYKAIHEDSAPSYLRELVQQRQVRALRSNTVALQLVERRTYKDSYGDRSFAAFAPKLWNRLPPSVRNSSSLASFKKALKTFLFIQHYGQ